MGRQRATAFAAFLVTGYYGARGHLVIENAFSTGQLRHELIQMLLYIFPEERNDLKDFLSLISLGIWLASILESNVIVLLARRTLYATTRHFPRYILRLYTTFLFGRYLKDDY